MILGCLLLVLGALMQDLQGQSGAENLSQAEEGIVDTSWPKKPGTQLSSISGKMKDCKQIAPKEYVKGKDLESSRMFEDKKASSLAGNPLWEKNDSSLQGRSAPSNEKMPSSWDHNRNALFDPSVSQTGENRIREKKELSQPDVLDWSSRSSRSFHTKDGSLRMYEGRLIHVKEQISQEETHGERDLGEGRAEKFTPAEVQKILKKKKGSSLNPVRAESPAASPPSTAGS
jgi:hypothetical protein